MGCNLSKTAAEEPPNVVIVSTSAGPEPQTAAATRIRRRRLDNAGHEDPEVLPIEEWDQLKRYLDDTIDNVLSYSEQWSGNDREQHGPVDEALQSGAIALLDMQWLVDFALYKDDDDDDDGPSVLPYRQKLPPQAFLSYEHIKLVRGKGVWIQYTALSYMVS